MDKPYGFEQRLLRAIESIADSLEKLVKQPENKKPKKQGDRPPWRIPGE